MTKKKISEKLDTIVYQIDSIRSEKVAQLEKDSQKLKELESLLSLVRLSVKRIVPMEDGKIKIIYNAPSVVFDTNAIGRNDTLYAINMLGLIDFEDMQKIQNAIDNIE